MKKLVKSILLSTGLYYRIKYSVLFRLYQHLFQRQALAAQKHEEAFYQSFLPRCCLVFDIGAYDGHKTAAFLTIAKKVVSCEPDKSNFQLLKIRFRNQKKRVFLVNKGLAGSPGITDYFIHAKGSAFNTMSRKFKQLAEEKGEKKWREKVQFTEKKAVEVTTLDLLIAQYGRPDFIKIDTEGFEPEVIKGLSHPVPCLSFECIYPEYDAELRQIISHLEFIAGNQVTYNLAYEEKLLLPHFVEREALLQTIAARNLPYFEVIARCDVSAQ